MYLFALVTFIETKSYELKLVTLELSVDSTLGKQSSTRIYCIILAYKSTGTRGGKSPL